MAGKSSLSLLSLAWFGTMALAGEPTFILETFRIASNVPVTVALDHDRPQELRPMYRTVHGQWQELPFEWTGSHIRFRQPLDALPEMLVLMTKPDWLTLPDRDAPVVSSIRIGEEEIPAADFIDLGHVNGAPKQLCVTAEDRLNPIPPSRVKATVDGVDLSASGGGVTVRYSSEHRVATVAVAVGDLDIGDHTLSLVVADSAPGANAVTFRLRFSTLPLLANGGFERAQANGRPAHWSTSAWSATEQTEAEFGLVDDGRTGRALLINGVSPPLNLVCGQAVDLLPGESYVLSGYYKNDGPGAYASVIAKLDGKQDQYVNMPRLPHSPVWEAFSWTFTAKSDNTDFWLYVRSTHQGRIHFDDLVLLPAH